MSIMSPGAPKRVLVIGSFTDGVLTQVASGGPTPLIDCSGYTNLVLYVKATAALSAGTIIIEERDAPEDSAGTIATITLSTPFSGAGGTYAYHLQTAAYGFLNARIGTSVVGGLISAVLRSC